MLPVLGAVHHPDALALRARAELDRRAAAALVKACCSRCGVRVNALVATGFGWRQDVYGRPGVGLGRAALVCNWCADRLVDPLEVVRRDWFDASCQTDAWYPGLEAYESQFAGAHTWTALFAAGTRLVEMRLPDTGGDDWYIAHSDAASVLAQADCF